MRWCRLHADTVNDPKIRLLAFEDRWHFIALLCIKSDGLLDQGLPPDLLDRQVAVILGLTVADAVKARQRLEDVGLVDPDWQPVKWNKRQFVSDTSTDRVRAHRRRRAQENQRLNGDARSGNVSETPPDTDTDTEKDKRHGSPDGEPARLNKRNDARFKDFWDAYPIGRKVGKKKALQAWKRLNLDKHADKIIEDVKARCARDPQWRESVRLIPHPTTYLNGERWEDEWDVLDAGADPFESAWAECKALASRLGLEPYRGMAGQPPENPRQFMRRVVTAARVKGIDPPDTSAIDWAAIQDGLAPVRRAG